MDDWPPISTPRPGPDLQLTVHPGISRVVGVFDRNGSDDPFVSELVQYVTVV